MTNVNTKYEAKVKEARAAARDILRLEKVSALLGYIRNINAKIKRLAKGREDIVESYVKAREALAYTLAKAEHRLSVATSTSDPDLEKITKEVEKTRESNTKELAALAKREARELENYDERAAEEKTELDAKNKEYEEKIAKWNTGESKVDYDLMVSISLDLLKDKVTADFTMGAYEGTDGDAEPAAPEATS